MSGLVRFSVHEPRVLPGKMQTDGKSNCLGRRQSPTRAACFGAVSCRRRESRASDMDRFFLRLDLTTISFVYLLLVVSTALVCGFWQASLISLLAACLDYFFSPPFICYFRPP